MPLTNFPNGVYGTPLIGADHAAFFQGTSFANSADTSNIYFVDGDKGADGNDGHSPDNAKLTIGGALTKVQFGGVVYIKARKIAAGGTDPVSYAETVTIGPSQGHVKLIGISNGIAQGSQPQIKKGSGAVAMITVQAPGCLIYGLTINMVGSTAAGILLDDDASTKTAFGTTIMGCVFKGNANKTSAAGAVAINTNGGAWQLWIKDNHFVDCGTGINALGTVVSPLKDIVIENNTFYAFANTDVDADIMFNVGIFGNAIVVRDNYFGTVDVPGFAGGATARYIDLTGCTNSVVADNYFACVGKTFGATGNAAKIPTTARLAGNYQEVAAGANATGEVGRT